MAINKTKNIYLDILQEDFEMPKDNQRIVKVLSKHPNHIFEVIEDNGNVFRAILHSRFQKTVWVKVNKLVIVEDIEGGLPEIVKVPTEDYIKFLQKNNAIPSVFSKDNQVEMSTDQSDDIFVNTNQRRIEYSSSSESSSEDDTV